MEVIRILCTCTESISQPIYAGVHVSIRSPLCKVTRKINLIDDMKYTRILIVITEETTNSAVWLN